MPAACNNGHVRDRVLVGPSPSRAEPWLPLFTENIQSLFVRIFRFIFDSMFIPANTCADSSLYIRIYTYISVYIYVYIYNICALSLLRAAISITFPSTCFVVVLFVEKQPSLRWHANPVLTGRDSMGVCATCMGERGKGK